MTLNVNLLHPCYITPMKLSIVYFPVYETMYLWIWLLLLFFLKKKASVDRVQLWGYFQCEETAMYLSTESNSWLFRPSCETLGPPQKALFESSRASILVLDCLKLVQLSSFCLWWMLLFMLLPNNCLLVCKLEFWTALESTLTWSDAGKQI